MHGGKRWIRRYDGRLKRSNDRTKKDRAGKYVRSGRYRYSCKGCDELAKLSGCRYYGPRCEDCRMRAKMNWEDGNQWDDNGVPRWAKVHENQQYRARTRNLMRQGRFDDLPPVKICVAYNYW